MQSQEKRLMSLGRECDARGKRVQELTGRIAELEGRVVKEREVCDDFF
jgi:hypothetical protein